MPTITFSRADIFGPSTSVAVYPAAAARDGAPPIGSSIASASTDSAGAFTITNAGILQGVPYAAYALINGEHRYLRVRSTLDVTDRGVAVGTATLNGTTALTSVVASSGAFAIGQRISGAGIPPGTRLFSGSGANWTMTGAATASGAGVAIAADGARAPVVVLGAAPTPQTISTTWQAKVRQRRAAAGTS